MKQIQLKVTSFFKKNTEVFLLILLLVISSMIIQLYNNQSKKVDEEYLKVLRETIPKVIDQFEPEFIFYLSGVDVLENDKLGRLSLTINGCKERDRFILEICKNNSIPVQVSMGGGYSVILKNIIEAHSNTFRLAQEIFF